MSLQASKSRPKTHWPTQRGRAIPPPWCVMNSTSAIQPLVPFPEPVRARGPVRSTRPPDEVGRGLTDWERLREWSPALLGMSGDIRHGQRVQCEYRFRENEVTPKHALHYEEGRELGWSGPMLPGYRKNAWRGKAQGAAGRRHVTLVAPWRAPVVSSARSCFRRSAFWPWRHV